MEKVSEQIANLVAEAERVAFKKGWDAAITAVTQAAAKIASAPDQATATATIEGRDTTNRGRAKARPHLRRAWHRKGVTQRLVIQKIEALPGIIGADIARALSPQGIKERTIRTALRRLRLEGAIVKKGDGWYKSDEAPSHSA